MKYLAKHRCVFLWAAYEHNLYHRYCTSPFVLPFFLSSAVHKRTLCLASQRWSIPAARGTAPARPFLPSRSRTSLSMFPRSLAPLSPLISPFSPHISLPPDTVNARARRAERREKAKIETTGAVCKFWGSSFRSG